ncbi:MAG: radical SAM protein [Candidatus Bathyarchaeum sp.]|nr:MAG: radical SAM protein [Candidatus Bathyarchaeum sp.]
MTDTNYLETIRVSTGSAMVLGLLKGKLDAKPTTAYLLMCRTEKCSANCGFCPQAKESKGRADMLSRVTWPKFPTSEVVKAIRTSVENGKIERVCLQSLNYPQVFDDVMSLVKKIKSEVDVAVSVSCKPLDSHEIKRWKQIGVNRVSIALDASTPQIFDEVKGKNIGGPYSWENQREALKEAVKVFGHGSVSTHLIVGLGETEKQLCQTIQWCIDSGVYPALFAFTPISGTSLENKSQPTLNHYRRVQLAHYLLMHKKCCIEKMGFGEDEKITDFGVNREQLLEVIDSGEPFRTSGCPGCNRPYYNESPGGPLYNYPRVLLREEVEKIKKMLGI